MNEAVPQLKIISIVMLVLGVLIEIFAMVRIGMEGELGPSLVILVSGTMLITLGTLFLALSRNKS